MDKTLALIALACLVAFMGVMLSFVVEPDLIIVTVIVLVMAMYDFWRQLYREKKAD